MEARKFTYHYNASALGLGGVLKYEKSGVKSGVTIARSLASVVLAPTGGEGFSEISHDSDGISFSRAISHITGYDSGYRTFTTKSNLYMADLNLFDRVKAASLQLSITSTREVLPTATLKTEKENPDQNLFSMSSMIVGLTIDGVEITPEFDLDLCKCATYADFAAQINKNCAAYARQFGVTTAHLQTVLAAKPLPIRGSLVKNLRYTPTPAVGSPQGFKIQVENFGTVHIGELIVKEGTRTANLLRIDFNAKQKVDQPAENSEGSAPSRSGKVTTTTVKPPVDFDAKQKVDQPAQTATGRETSEGSALSRAVEVTTTTMKSPDDGTGTILSLTGNGAPNWP